MLLRSQVNPRCVAAVRGRGRGHMTTVCAASSSTAAKSSARSTSFHHGVSYTSYEVNTFMLKFNATGARVLIDPWLVGELTFANTGFLYRGKKRVIGRTVNVDVSQVAGEADVVILTQGLPDHTHMPTLELLPRETPIIANPDAAKKIKPLGFKNVTVLDHEQTVPAAGGRLAITATKGALVGPPWSKRQNGLVFREVAPPEQQQTPGQEWRGASVYFEPHCDFEPESVKRVGQVDVVISPTKTAGIGTKSFSYPLTMGDINLVQLLQITRPKVLVPLLNSEIDHEGPLAAALVERGDYDTGLRSSLQQGGLGDVRIEMPAPPGEALAIAL